MGIDKRKDMEVEGRIILNHGVLFYSPGLGAMLERQYINTSRLAIAVWLKH